jgi:hypothetical protein
MTTDDADKVAMIQRFDTHGGAIEIRFSAARPDDLTIVK